MFSYHINTNWTDIGLKFTATIPWLNQEFDFQRLGISNKIWS